MDSLSFYGNSFGVIPDPFNDSTMQVFQDHQNSSKSFNGVPLLCSGILTFAVPLLGAAIFEPGELQPTWATWDNYWTMLSWVLPILATLTIAGTIAANRQWIAQKSIERKFKAAEFSPVRHKYCMNKLAERLNAIPEPYRSESRGTWNELVTLLSADDETWNRSVLDAAEKRYKAIIEFVEAAEAREKELANMQTADRVAELLQSVESSETESLGTLTKVISEMNENELKEIL